MHGLLSDVYYSQIMNDFIEETKDSNGTILQNGDSVSVIKDLKLKGSSTTLKIGTVFKNIRLTDDVEEIECKE